MMPNGWEKKKLGEIVKEKISYGIVQAGPHDPLGIPYIKSSDLNGGIVPHRLQRTAANIHSRYRRSAVHPGDIIFSLRGNLGEVAIVPDSLEEANLTQGTARISVKENQDNLYHYYQMSSEPVLNVVCSLSKGSTFKEISLEALRRIEVYCPPYDEQKKISSIISTWDESIIVAGQLLANSRTQKKALAQGLLTGRICLPNVSPARWKNYYLDEVAQVEKGKALSSKDLSSGNYPVIAGGMASPYSHSEYTHESAITVSASGAYAGFIAYHPYKIWASDCSVVLPKPTADINFLHQLLMYHQNRIYRLQTGGAQPHVYPKDLAALKVSMPELKEQKKIAEVLINADREIAVLTQFLWDLKLEKKALLQKLLTGKHRVTIKKEIR